MRMLKFNLAACALLAFTGLAVAEDAKPLQNTPHFNTCRDEAKAKANDYVADYIAPATDGDMAPKGSYVAIVYGHKFAAPLHPPANGDLQLHGVGEVVARRAQVYREELRRCLGYVRFDLALKHHITIIE